MDSLQWTEQPRLTQPVFLACFAGWNDAADAATEAAQWLARRYESRPIATFDPDSFYDFQSTRPMIELVDGVIEDVEWPTIEMFAIETGGSRDIVLLTGEEPNYQWRQLSKQVTEAADVLGCDMMVTFGALLGEVPHTRPLRVTGAASSPELMEASGIANSFYEGPTGIVGVIHDACKDSTLPSVSLWVPVPHYVGQPPNPLATHALLRHFERLTGIPIDARELEVASEAWLTRVNEVVAEDEDVAEYVKQLEKQYEEQSTPSVQVDQTIPSAEEIGEQVERFLRDQDSE